MRPNKDVVIPESNNNNNNNNNEEEELPDLNSFDNNEVQAITKIQSGFRGMQARKQVKDMKTEPTPSAPAESILSPRIENKELPPSTANSVAVSQAMFSPRNEPLPETARENIVKI